MEPETSHVGDEDDGELTTNQIKQKAQEIAKRFEKYHGRYQTSSSRCNTPLPITSADSIESIHSNSVISDTSEKVLLFRQYLENDRKLVENNKIDEKNYNSDDQMTDKSLDVKLPKEQDKHDAMYYEDIISATLNEKNINSLKIQIDELNEKLKNYHYIAIEKDVLLQSKNDKIETLNKAVIQKKKLHLEAMEELNRRNNEIISEERLKCTQKINSLLDETEDLKNNLEYVHQICDELKKKNMKIEKENTELRKKEINLKSDFENMNISYENEKKLLLKHNKESSKKIIDGMEKELQYLQQENDSLKNHLTLLESQSIDTKEKDNLLDQLKKKETEINHLNIENQKLIQEYKKITMELDQAENCQIHQKDIYMNDKDCMDKELQSLQQENDSLINRITILENNKSMNIQDNDNLLNQLNTEIDRLNIENKNLSDQYQTQTVETQQSQNHWIQLKDIYLNDKNCMEKELQNLQQENELLINRVALLENKSMDIEENDNILDQLKLKETEIHQLLLEKKTLSNQYQNQTIEVQQIKNHWVQLKDTYSNDKDCMEKELENLQQENNSLINRVALLENKSMDIRKNDNALDQLKIKESEIQHLNLENQKLNDQYQNQTIEAQKMENRWIQLKDAYLNDKNRMTFLEKVIDELKINNNELNDTNIKLTENVEKLMINLTDLKSVNSAHEERIADLMAVIENMREKFEIAMKETSIEFELDKKQLIQQHEDDALLLTTCNNKLDDTTSKLNAVVNQLNMILKENNSYKNKHLELNNVISELHKQISQLSNELQFYKNENLLLSDKIKEPNAGMDDYKLLSDRFQKQKQLLKIKMKTLKESENNCSLLQQQVVSLSKEMESSNQKSEYLVQCNKQINTVLQHCDIELQNCYELLNTCVIKSNLQNQSIYTLRCVLMSLATLFSFDENCVTYDTDLLKIFSSISDTVIDDNELQICLQKIVLGSIHVLEYVMNLNNMYKLSNVQLIARNEVDKLVSEAVESVKLSTQIEYHKQNTELLDLVENLKIYNHTLNLNIPSKTLETKEVLTDLNGFIVNNLFSLENVDVKNIKNENDTLKQFLNNIREQLGLVNTSETDDIQLQNSLSELELFVQGIKNDNILLKNQYNELQNLVSLKTLENSTEQYINKYPNIIDQNSFIQATENNEKKTPLSSDDIYLKQLENREKTNFSVNDDSKLLLVRYKNLKSRFKEIRAKTVELDKKIISLTNDLECANSKYKRLSDQYANANESHETDITQCQAEIENLMCEKLEAYRQLTALKEKHEILQNDYDQLKSNLDDKNSVDGTSTHINEQNTILKRQLNDIQRLIDSAYSTVLCEWPAIDSDSDWVVIQSRKLDEIVNIKCISPNNSDKKVDSFDLEESEVKRLKSCVQVIHELVTSILTNKCTTEVSSTNELVELMLDLKSCTETFLEYLSVKNKDLHLVDENHIELSQNPENVDSYPSKQPSNSEENSPLVQSSIVIKESIIKPSLSENEENEQFQRAIIERDRLIEFLSEKISKLDNLNRSVDDIRSIREKLDRALTAVHERDVRCDELTLELTRLLEERDMLQLKLSNSIRQIQFLSDNKLGTSNLLEDKYDSKTINDKLEELHSLEYRKDADLFTDQEQRHVSQMKLHQSHQGNPIAQGEKSSNVAEEENTSHSWFKDILW